MAKVTLVFAALLIALGLVGFLGTGSIHRTALIPAELGVLLGISGLLAMSPSESRRKQFMHINVTVGLVGCVGGAIEALRGYLHATSAGLQPDQAALASKLTMSGLLLIYVLLCVRSFIAVRRAGKI
jgi:hypothetical protein